MTAEAAAVVAEDSEVETPSAEGRTDPRGRSRSRGKAGSRSSICILITSLIIGTCP